MLHSIHDFSIIGISVENPEKMLVHLSDEFSKKKYDLVIDGVRKVAVDGFGLQNVVLDLKVFYSFDGSFEFRRSCHLLGLAYAGPEDFPQGDSMVFIEASVGAEIACLVKGVWSFEVTEL
ncbi:hypothetical protein FJU31_05140 [Stenotrophomonas cyclobalanopsidis]|uniref:Uncharacterized protein n=1 Tax=Stenotrophomonas cyclobalanopsidis TaxID=2771362 RepID=A0ABQ6T3Z7_9GAMM|nr:hypothetical protein [Stenotrophomonas cyclobalanopsidis]KAA9002261.1 hypothetical protein FJU31_05140 [Stenotrophomonas cyclobalanopsidis]